MADTVTTVNVKLVKGNDYTVFGKTFKLDEVVAVTPEQAKYLVKCDGYFEEVKPVVEAPKK